MILPIENALASSIRDCAHVVRSDAGGTEFINACPYPVYWTVECALGAKYCYGSSQLHVMPGTMKRRDYRNTSLEVSSPRKTPTSNDNPQRNSDHPKSCARTLELDKSTFGFENFCSYPVYWNVTCRLGVRCTPLIPIDVPPGMRVTQTLPSVQRSAFPGSEGLVDLEGPYQRRSGSQAKKGQQSHIEPIATLNGSRCSPYCQSSTNELEESQEKEQSDRLEERLRAIERGNYQDANEESRAIRSGGSSPSRQGPSEGAAIAKNLLESGGINSDLSSGFAKSIEQTYVTNVPSAPNFSSSSGSANSRTSANCQAEEQRMMRLSEPLGNAFGMCQSAMNYAKQMDLAAEFAARCSPHQVAEFRRLAAEARKSAQQTCSTNSANNISERDTLLRTPMGPQIKTPN